MLTVMHMIHSLGVGGLEQGVVKIINHTDPTRFRHHICCFTRAGALAREITTSGVRVFEMEKCEGHDWTLPVRIARLLREHRVDVVHTRNWATIDGILAAWLAGVPAVIHGEHGRDMTDLKGESQRRRWARRLLSWRVQRFITVSHDLRIWLVERVGISAEKVVTISNGVDCARFHPPEDRPRTTDADENASVDPPVVIGSVGRLDAVKAYDQLLHAFRRLRDRTPDVRLRIAGDGPERAALQALRRELGLEPWVEFLGEVSNVELVYRSFDIFVLPSLGEGMSNTILEAMASELPVVATNVGGNGELIIPEESGILVPAGDLEALVSALERYVRDPELRLRHAHAACRRSEEFFSLARMVASYEKIYESVARSAPRACAGKALGRS